MNKEKTYIKLELDEKTEMGNISYNGQEKELLALIALFIETLAENKKNEIEKNLNIINYMLKGTLKNDNR